MQELTVDVAGPTSIPAHIGPTTRTNLEKVNRIVFLSDLFKVDDRIADKSANPQTINIAWLHALFASVLQNILELPASLLTGEEPQHPLNRVALYHRKKLPMTSAGWASIYENLDCPETSAAIEHVLEGSLVVGFEMPPYLIRNLNKASVPYIDLSIHPIRYLPDYVFGIRSNVPTIHNRIVATRLSENVFRNFARISAARTVRVMRGWKPLPGSAMFLGQIEVDASLIHKGRIFDIQDMELQLLQLMQRYPKIYYKRHPHRKDTESIDKFLSSHPAFEVANVNIYDALACPEIFLVCSLSSGALMEAAYFGRHTERLLGSFNAYDLRDGITCGWHYMPAPLDIFSEDYWVYLLGQTAHFEPQTPNHCEGALKFSINQKWGR